MSVDKDVAGKEREYCNLQYCNGRRKVVRIKMRLTHSDRHGD
jgi:hypothetical protein